MSYRPMSSGMDMSLHLELYLTDPSLPISSILIPLLCFDLLSDSLRFFWVFGQYNFEGRYDLVRFIKTVQKIENEYGPESKAFGSAGHSYVNWAAEMAVGLKTGVPWVMCKEDDAPDPVELIARIFFSPCCDYRFTEFGGTIHHRPVEDLAFAVARFIQKGGSFINYYMAYFDAPDGNDPLALDMGSMGKGHVYHVPRSWLQPTRNLLVVFEELGGDATKISLAKRSISSVCADVSEWHPTIKNWHIENYGRPEEHRKPKVHLRCAPGQFISAIKFASYGTPIGTCGNFQQGVCHSPNSAAILEKVTKLISFILLRFDKHIYFLFINIAHYEIRFLEVPRTTNLG
ncbi:hypothetical protein BHE74_00020273 [Ensete ventricosum]|nr:hypothetical protein BHE74_00020273 [Ensete ventricosum]